MLILYNFSIYRHKKQALDFLVVIWYSLDNINNLNMIFHTPVYRCLGGK